MTTALVIGGGIAGLLAARALAPHLDDVVLCERDPLPESGQARKGVPQGPHAHVLVHGGFEALQALFGEEGLILDGARRTIASRDLKWFQFGVWKARCPSGLTAHWCDRPRLEAAIRERVARLANVRRLDRQRVLGLLAAEGGRRVAGVRVQDATGAERDVAADLVIEASGAGSVLPAWLQTLGWPEVAEERIRVDVGYATQVWRGPPPAAGDWQVLAIYPRPPAERRSGLVYPLDRERWLVTLTGWLGDHPPADQDGFVAFARSLPRSDLAAWLEHGRPEGPIRRHAFPHARWRRFERLPGWPERLVALGDAICRFNPIYGQGMSVAAKGALALEGWLARGGWQGPGATRRLQRALGRLPEVPWRLSSSMDFRYPEVEGRRPPGLALLNAYVARILEASGRNARINLRVLEVLALSRSPLALFAPGIALPVLAGRRVR